MITVLRVFVLIFLIIGIKSAITKIFAVKMRKELIDRCHTEKNSFRDNVYLLFDDKNKGILMKVLISVVFIIFAMFNGVSAIKAFGYGIAVYGIILWYRRIKSKNEEKQVLQDLLNISECLRVQLSSGISLETALRSIPELCVNKVFKSYLTNLYLEYEFSKFTVGKASNDLQERFNYPEIKMFISGLNQQNQGTSALEAFDNLTEVLKEKYIDYMEETTKNKVMIITFGVFISVINIAALSIYPVIMEVIEAMKTILM